VVVEVDGDVLVVSPELVVVAVAELWPVDAVVVGVNVVVEVE